MSDRFTKIYDLPTNLYLDGAPVIIRAGALYIDNLSGNVVVQHRIQSISPKTIRTVTVSIFSIDGSGNKTDSPMSFQYLDLSISRDQEFGQKKLIYLPDKNTRSFEVRVTEVIYSDRSIWSSSDEVWEPIQPQLKRYASFSNVELTKQFKIRYGDSAEFIPARYKNLILCTCGAVNRANESQCHKCGNNIEYILSYDRESLEKDKEIRLAKEEQKALEKQEKQKKVNAVLKKIALSVACVAALALAVYGIGWHAIPAIRYNSADKAVSEKEFDKAYSTFSALGDYKDSRERTTETLYEKATFLKDNEDFSAAKSEFEKILSYSDSAEQAAYCGKKAAYLEAMSLLESKEYEKAAGRFTNLGKFENSAELAAEANYLYAKELFAAEEYNKALELLKGLSKEKYKDSAELLKEVTYQINHTAYLEAKSLLESKEYEKAAAAFADLGKFEDSAKLVTEAKYLFAKELFANKNYNKTLELLKELSKKKYKDSSDLLQEATYQYAIDSFENQKYEEAYNYFTSIAEYKDVPDRITEATYQYALQLEQAEQWDNSRKLFKTIQDFNDSYERWQESEYQYALGMYNQKKYIGAINSMESLGDYKDCQTILLEAKYQYAKSHLQNGAPITFDYLTELCAQGYKDSQQIYNDLYSWKATLTAFNTNPNDYKNIASSASRYSNYLHFQFKVSGGKPGESVTISVRTDYPDGTIEYLDCDTYMGNISCEWPTGIYYGPGNRTTGKLTVYVYIKETGEYIGEGSIYIN